MKVYEAVFKEGETEGVYALSVVENPAMEDFWITLSEQPEVVELAQVDEEKRLLLGAALIPNKKIYRNIDGNEFYITFSDKTIETLSHEFLKKQNNNNSSLEHEVSLNGMSVVESWIVEDPNKDKSNSFGKTYEKGTWVAMMKVDNDEMWQKVKEGEIKGFSIDALLGLQEINLKSNIKMNTEDLKSFKDSLVSDIKALFTTNEPEEVNEPTVEAQAEAVEVEAPEVVEEPAFDAEAFARELKETLSVEFKSQLEEVIKAKDAEIETLKTELSKQAEEESVSVTPEVKTELKSFKYGSNRPKSIQDRVFAALNQ